VVIISGHIDSRVSDVMDATKDAPGANDDGSGTAAVIEAARVLSRHKFPATIVYAVLSGEEQGLHGGKIMADYAKAQGWDVIANLNNDIIGNSCGSDGKCDDMAVRVFSEGPRWQGREDLAAASAAWRRERLAVAQPVRWLDSFADDQSLGLDVRQIWRNDRFGRGGDHTEMLNAGYPRSASRSRSRITTTSIRICGSRTASNLATRSTRWTSVSAKVVKLNVAALAALARTPAVPSRRWKGAVRRHELSWPVGARRRSYIVRWRRRMRRTGSIAFAWGYAAACSRRSGFPGAPSNRPVRDCPARYSGGRLRLRRVVRLRGRLRKPGRFRRAGRAFRPYTPPPPPRGSERTEPLILRRH
jgi:hypothetical protein